MPGSWPQGDRRTCRQIPGRINPLKSATITDVARRAGVSIKTVSRVVNHEAGVSDDKRRRVHVAIQALDYRANEHARQLAARRA
ncbi:MAG: LacI family transcriptional regulator [Chromatiales bacterium]|nr:MAG: LacI family transcriptional regulator [Chromatiales bacterium]